MLKTDRAKYTYTFLTVFPERSLYVYMHRAWDAGDSLCIHCQDSGVPGMGYLLVGMIFEYGTFTWTSHRKYKKFTVWVPFQYKDRFLFWHKSSIIKRRRWWDRPNFILVIPILVRLHLYIGTVPGHTWWRHQMETFFRGTGHLCGEFNGDRWIPHTKAIGTELWCFLWSAPWIHGWVDTRKAGDLRRHRAYYDVIVMNQTGSRSL